MVNRAAGLTELSFKLCLQRWKVFHSILMWHQISAGIPGEKNDSPKGELVTSLSILSYEPSSWTFLEGEPQNLGANSTAAQLAQLLWWSCDWCSNSNGELLDFANFISLHSPAMSPPVQQPHSSTFSVVAPCPLSTMYRRYLCIHHVVI